jgi:ABC-type dipeptide/oligopeptide/nickel transport system ATPase component
MTINLNLNYRNIVNQILDDVYVYGIIGGFTDFYKIPNNLDIKIIALMGEMGSGKSTIAKMVEEKWSREKKDGQTEVVSFASEMKYFAHFYSGIDRNDKVKCRDLYQTFGEECRKIDPLIWVKCLMSDIYIRYSHGTKYFIIDDLRLPHERLWAYKNEIPVIKVEAHPIIRKERMEKRGDVFTSEMMNHDTEKWVNILDYHLKIENNVSDLDILRKKVDHLIDRELPNLFVDFDESWGD